MLTVHLVLATNLPVSVTRVVADAATALRRLGARVVVWFPVADWLDFKRFEIARVPWKYKVRWIFWLVMEVVRNALIRTQWCGFAYYHVDPSVATRRYFVAPALPRRAHGEIAVIHHPYLLPHLLHDGAASQDHLVSVIHNNYELECQSPWPEAAAWKQHCVRLEQQCTVPRIATSEQARQAAERLGIPVQRVIRGGIDLQVFHPATTQRPVSPAIIMTLYCETNVQKGQLIGIEAVRGLQQLVPGVRLHSLGHVLPEHAALFDRNHGYLHGEDYVRAIQASDIFIYPSLYDGFPAPPLHALACGAALVTTAVEGVIEYGRDGDNCLLCEPGDAAVLRSRILQVIHDPGLRTRLQTNGPLTAQAYSIERSARELLEFLCDLAAPHRASALQTIGVPA